MLLQKILEATNYKISRSVDYLWDCYGPNAKYLDFYDTSQNEYASCVYDTNTQEVYEIEVIMENVAYKWYNPIYFNKLSNEAKEKNVDLNIAWDNIKWVACMSTDDIIKHL